MDNLDFSEEEIQEQLAILGYKNIPKHRLLEFKQDLEELVRREEWKSLASSTQINSDKSQVATSQPSPPAYTKEKVSRQCYFKGSGEGFFLHTGQPGNGRQVLITQVPCDSYAQHSVALKLQLPPGAPSRLHVEPDPDPDDTLDPPLTDSYTSTPDSHRGRFIKRKVLRKHKGQSLVCDESVYSEDSALCLHRSHTSAGVQVANMYKTYGSQWDRESEGDDNSLNSSFWSDGERQEDEDEVKIEGVISKEDSKTVGNAEDTYQKALEEEEVRRERVIAEEDSKPVSGSEGSYQEEKIERLVVKEERKPVADSEECQDETSEEEELSVEESKAVGDEDDSYTDSSEEEEEEEIGRVISEEDSKSVADSEGSYTEASEEEVENSEEDSKPVGDTENSYTEASDEEEEETEQVCGKEEPKPVDDTEDSYAEASDEEEEEETERVIGEEDAKTVGDSEGYDHEASEEEEEEEENDVEDSKSVGNTEDFSQEASEEEEEENNEEESKPSGDAEDFNTEASEEEETERANGEEDSKHGSNSEDSFQEASKEEEEEEMGEEDSHHVEDAGDSYQEASEEEKPELNDQVNISRESLEGGSKDDNDDEEEESCSSSSDSPAPSLMTSGYGTYRPEEVEGGDYRDDHTITEFDQDSRGDLSETREDEEEDSRSLCSFSGFDIEATEPDYHETRPLSMLANTKPKANVLCRNDDMRIKEDDAEVKLEDEDQSDEEKLKALHAASEKKVTSPTSEEQRRIAVAEDTLDWKPLEGGSDDVGGGKLCQRVEEEKLDLKEENKEKEVEDKGESEEPDESSSNKDIKFIDSKVDFSQMTYDKMCEEWEGNLRQKKDAASCLEERLADLHLSSPAQRNFETENEDVTSQSDTQSSETEGVSFSAFESYMRGMTRAQSDGDLRPKPKSFIRPVMSQQTIKKTDPVAKYFQYKQLWEMFKLPGEKDRRALRLEIKERLAYQPPPPKPRRVYVPNTYIVPTEKKRSALRWEIRNDLANGVLPHKFSYRF